MSSRFKMRTILSVLVCVMLVFGTANASAQSSALGVAVSSVLPTKDNTNVAQGIHTIAPQDELIAQNNALEMYLNVRDFVLKIKNKKTGYVFSSSVKKDMMQGMSTEWQRLSQSMLSMDFISPNGAEKRSALKHATAKKPVITKKSDGFVATVNFFEAKITLDMEVTLTDKGFKVDIPDDKIVSDKGNVISKLMILPFFGNAYSDTIPGYMFVPDGSGALMDYSIPRMYNQSYVKRVYGKDISVIREAEMNDVSSIPVEQSSITMPVFGAVHGVRQNGFVGIINSGDAYCEINASPAGVIVDYSWIAPSFIYNQLYWQPSGKGQGFNTVQTTQNVVNPQVEYVLLSGDDATYVGMAKEYKSRLTLNGRADLSADKSADIPIKLDALMAEPTKSLFGTTPQVMTKMSDINSWVDVLSQGGVKNNILTLMGFEKKGASGHTIGNFDIEGRIGNSNELKNLEQKLGSSGYKLYLQSDITKGYMQQVSKTQLRYGMDTAVTSIVKAAKLFNETVFVKDEAIAQHAKKLTELGYNLSIPSLAVNLYSDNNRRQAVDRYTTMQNAVSVLKDITTAKSDVILQDPNAYALRYATAIYDTPTNHSQLMYFTQAVPFKQIVLSGSVDCFSSYLNYGTNSIEDMLRLIDYNTYPSYILTQEYSNKLSKTNMDNIYSSRFDDLSMFINENYNYLNGILSQVRGCSVVDRLSVQDGVSITKYSNGKTIAVNYSDSNARYLTHTLAPKSAVVVEGV